MKIIRRIKYFLIRLFRLKASPHHVALGLILGLIPNWIPTFGIGPFISVSLARLVRANTIAALIGGVLGIPLWPLLFFLNYKVGSFLFINESKVDELEEVEYIDTFRQTYNWIDGSYAGGILFLTGAIINILISSILIYFITYFLFKKYRARILKKIRSTSI